jgi:hypothetical protein
MKTPWEKENLICYLFADALGEANSRAAGAAMMKDRFSRVMSMNKRQAICPSSLTNMLDV